MGAIRPGSWKHFGAETMSPDESKRRASGFWEGEYRIDNNETVWRCNIPVLHDTIRGILMDQRESQLFTEDPRRYLDVRFGEGTSEAYFMKREQGKDFLQYRDRGNPFRAVMGMDLATKKDMTMAYLYNTGTTSTNTTSTNTTIFNGPDATKKWIDADLKRSIKQKTKHRLDRNTFIWPMKIPFTLSGGRSLLEQLQFDFDKWAGDMMPAKL